MARVPVAELTALAQQMRELALVVDELRRRAAPHVPPVLAASVHGLMQGAARRLAHLPTEIEHG